MSIEPLKEYLLSAVVTGLGALFTYLGKSFLKRFSENQKKLYQEMIKIEGKLDMLAVELRKNTIENAKLQTEVKAVWRFIDRSHQRASDNGGRYE